jgi:hypothetical protein
LAPLHPFRLLSGNGWFGVVKVPDLPPLHDSLLPRFSPDENVIIHSSCKLVIYRIVQDKDIVIAQKLTIVQGQHQHILVVANPLKLSSPHVITTCKIHR